MEPYPMKNNIRILIILALISGLASSCRLRKKGSNDPSIERNTSETLTKQLESANWNQEYLSFKTKASYSDGKNQQSFNLHLKMKKDSIMWVSITALGIEAGRALVFPDSVMVIDRLNRKYFVYDYSYLEKLAKIPVSFDQLQNILFGNPLFPSPQYRLTENEGRVEMRYEKMPLENRISLDRNLRVQNSVLVHQTENRSMNIQYASFNKIDKQLLPLTISVLMKQGMSEARLTLNHSNVSTEPIDQFPFSIPQGYARGN